MSDSNKNKSETEDQVTDETMVASERDAAGVDNAADVTSDSKENDGDMDEGRESRKERDGSDERDEAEDRADGDGHAPHENQDDSDESDDSHSGSMSGDNDNILEQNPEDLKTIGDLLRYHRVRMGMSVSELANTIMVQKRTVSDMESNSLNDRVYINFVKNVLSRYSRITGLDFDYMLNLYMANIAENVTIDREPAATAPDKTMNRNWLLIALIVIVAVCGYFIFSGDEKESSGSANAPSGEPVRIEMNADGSEAASQPVIIEDPANAGAAEVVVVDANTARAAAQADALSRTPGPEGLVEITGEKAPESLTLPGDSYTVTARVPAIAIKPGAEEEAAAAGAGAASGGAASGGADSGGAASAGASKPGAASGITIEPGSGEQAAAGSKGNASDTRGDAEKVADATKAAQEKIELKGKPADISGKVKVVNRKTLSSLNSAEVAVTARVALKLTDKQNKVLASGVYEPGRKIKVTGIPPLKIQLSDTRAVKIYYDGGEVDMPEAKQVILKLPMP